MARITAVASRLAAEQAIEPRALGLVRGLGLGRRLRHWLRVGRRQRLRLRRSRRRRLGLRNRLRLGRRLRRRRLRRGRLGLRDRLRYGLDRGRRSRLLTGRRLVRVEQEVVAAALFQPREVAADRLAHVIEVALLAHDKRFPIQTASPSQIRL
jgi:hypothetical protein